MCTAVADPKKSSTTSSSGTSAASSLRCLEPATHLVNNWMEKLFYRLGYLIGCHPWYTIGLALSFCLLMGGGLALWREEHDEVALWTTEDSRIRRNSQWVDRHFSADVRYESVIVTADNVLTQDVLLFMAELDASVKDITTPDGYQWTDVCARFGSALKGKTDQTRRRRRSIPEESSASNEDPFDWPATATDAADAEDYDLSALDFSGIFDGGDGANTSSSGGLFGSTRANHLVNLLSMPDLCLFRNILEIWDSDTGRLIDIHPQQIVRDVNTALEKGTNQSLLDSMSFLLSDTEVDADGRVIKAGATIMTWLLDNDRLNSSIYDQWERLFVERTLRGNISVPAGVHIYSLASKSYEEALAETLTSNLTILMAGFSLIIFYFSFAMGKFNWIEQRLLLSIVGVSVVGQAILASYGLCFYLGVFYGPVHPTIPFLLLGIGVDDMFVIIQALDNLTSDEKQRPIPERMATAMRHAGVSITVTSVTDIAAFAIGATTSMPALRSFCINATAGIFVLFILEVTFFVALTVLDERRKEQRRIGCCLPPPQKDWKPSPCSQRELLKVFFDQFYGPFLLKTPVKVIVLLITAASVAVNIWGILQLEQNFDPNWYLKEQSYPAEYFNALKQYFPEIGERASIYTGRIDYVRERDQLNRMVELLRSDPYIKSTSVVYWYEDFQFWLNRTDQEFPGDETTFKQNIQEYLFSPEGRHYLQDIKVDGSILDLQGNFTITGSRARFRHLSLHNSSAKNTALESITSLSNQVYFGDDAEPSIPIVYTYTYVEWEANKVISSELIRNLGLTMAAVVGVTLVLISDLVTVFWVFTCIAFTLIDLLGLMYYWGLTVEIASSIIVILAAGLAIDYSAHIGHTFTTIRGSKSRRARVTLTRMGPAVWNGGFSTFLAFVLLVNTDSHIFTTFFKLFFGVVVFGLFHGLAYLPVVLSWFGPPEKELMDHADLSTVVDSFHSSPERPSSDASTEDLSPATDYENRKNKSVVHHGKSMLALDNPAFISDHFQILYDAQYGYHLYNQEFTAAAAVMEHKPMRKDLKRMQLEDQGVPYIPQPDYTPALPRRTLNTQGSYVAGVQMLPRIGKSGSAVDMSGDLRDWQHSQWNSSQFPASDWNAALMKRISEEAQLKRVDRIRIREEVDQTLDQFESEMDSYLDDRSSDPTVEQRSSPVEGASVTLAAGNPAADAVADERIPGSSSSSSSGSSTSTLHSNSVEDVAAATSRRDRDQESLESGYLSSYPGYIQRPNSGIY